MRNVLTCLTCLAALVGLSLATPAPLDAAVVNGGFEANLSSWNQVGGVAVVTAAYGETPTQGARQALAVTDAATVSDARIEAFLGLPIGTLDGLGAGDAIEGAAFRQSFSVTAGDVLAFDWSFLTDESTPDGAFNDFAFWSLTPANNGQLLADTFFGVFDPSATPFSEQTGYQTVTFVMPFTGSVTLGFGVIDLGDANGGAGLLVDNVAINGSVGAAVPEPVSFAIWGIAAAALGYRIRRQRAPRAS